MSVKRQDRAAKVIVGFDPLVSQALSCGFAGPNSDLVRGELPDYIVAILLGFKRFPAIDPLNSHSEILLSVLYDNVADVHLRLCEEKRKSNTLYVPENELAALADTVSEGFTQTVFSFFDPSRSIVRIGRVLTDGLELLGSQNHAIHT